MRIRFLIENAYVSGGTVRTTINTAAALANRGHDVEIVSVHRRRAKPFFPIPDNVRLRALVDAYSLQQVPQRPPRLPVRLFRRAQTKALDVPSLLYTKNEGRYQAFSLASDVALVRYLRSVPDGVIVGTRPGLNLAIARWVKPAVVRVGQDHLNLGRYREGLRQQIARHYGGLDALVTLTNGDAADYTALLGDRTRTLAVPNGVPDVGGHAATLDESNKVVIAAGGLRPQKGFDRLVSAWALVAPEHPDWRLEIYGTAEPPRRRKLQRKIDSLGVTDSAHIMGPTQQLYEIMAMSSVFTLPSRFEGLPMVLLEAMQIGVPVVAFDCPTGPRDVIDDEVDGLLVPNGDIEAFGRAIDRLIREPLLRKSLAARAAEKIKQYDTPRLAEQWEELFTELATTKG